MLGEENKQMLYSIMNLLLVRLIFIFGILIGVIYIFIWTGANITIFEPYLFFIIAFLLMSLFLEKNHKSVLL